MAAPFDGDLVEQPRSDLPAASAPVGPGSGGPGGIAVIDPSAVVPSLDKRNWPEWARTGESNEGGLKPRRAAAGAVGFSRTFVGWSIWREQSLSRRAAANPGTARVVVVATCTSIVVSLATIWLSAPDGPLRKERTESAETVMVPDRPLDTMGLPQPVRVAALPVGVAAVPVADDRDLRPAPPRVRRASLTPSRSEAARASRISGAAAGGAATLVVITEPEGARVTINGLAFGTSPLTVRDLPPGAKRIRVTKDGYGGEERIVAADAARIGATLRIELREADAGPRR